MAWDLGGAGPCVRTAMSCVGAARCEHVLHQRAEAPIVTLVNNFTDDVHRPALPYKFKFKVSGCGNDCHERHRTLPTSPSSAPGATT